MLTYIVVDMLSGKKYYTAKEAWEVYKPDVSYRTFLRMLKLKKLSNLVITPVECGGMSSNNYIKKRGVTDLEKGKKWSSIAECARSLKVSRQSVQLAVKRGNRCKGRLLAYCTIES